MTLFFSSYLPNVVRFIKPRMREMTKRQQLDALKRPTYTRDDTGSFAFACGACILYSMGVSDGESELEISFDARAFLSTLVVTTRTTRRRERRKRRR